MSMGKYIALFAQGDRSSSALLCGSTCSHLHQGGRTRANACRSAWSEDWIPAWALTAVIYARAVLMHQFGLRLEDID
jgi:hypothetical protein